VKVGKKAGSGWRVFSNRPGISHEVVRWVRYVHGGTTGIGGGFFNLRVV